MGSLRTERRVTTTTTTRMVDTGLSGESRMRAVSTEDLRDILQDYKTTRGQYVVTDTMAALVNDVNATAEVLRRGSSRPREEEMTRSTTTLTRTPTPPMERMIDTGIYGHGRMRTVSTEDMHRLLDDVKANQGKKVVTDTLAALVTDINATTEVLRRGQTPKREEMERLVHVESAGKWQSGDNHTESAVVDSRPMSAPPPAVESDSDYYSEPPKFPISRLKGAVKVLPIAEPIVEYHLRMTPQPRSVSTTPFPNYRPKTPDSSRGPSVDRLCEDFDLYGVPDDSTRKRNRSETPGSRLAVRLEGTPEPRDLPICAVCMLPIEGACVTALAPSSQRAQKFHPHHFVCNYCTTPLNLKGTYKEHDKKPYCHNCFHKLFSGHIYAVEGRR